MPLLWSTSNGTVGNKRKSCDVLPVRTIELKDTLLNLCQERNDAWAHSVMARILSVHDLHAADAVYHKSCDINFRTMKKIPTAHSSDKLGSKKLKLGRPKESERARAFLEVAKYLEENDDEQITVNTLVSKMETILSGSGYDAYSRVHMQSKLKEHFGNRIVITHVDGKSNIITFRETAEAVLQDFYNNQQNTDVDTEKIQLIRTAAKLIRNDIKSITTNSDFYPPYGSFESEDQCISFLPESLKILLEDIIIGNGAKMKIASIGQAIMQSARPRGLLAPLQFGLGVQLHHHYASRFFIDALHHHGFCCSYSGVQRFELNAALSCKTDIPNYTTESVQYVADNIDHNIRTLDGHNTFHGMGMVAIVTPTV